MYIVILVLNLRRLYYTHKCFGYISLIISSKIESNAFINLDDENPLALIDKSGDDKEDRHSIHEECFCCLL